MVNGLGLLSSQKFPLVPDNVRQTCFHEEAVAPLVHVLSDPGIRVTPRNISVFKLSEPKCTVTKIFSLPAPIPKSKTLFQARVIDGEIQNQLQMEIALGSVNEGSVKNWLLLGKVLALPVKNALFELAPNGPEA